MGHLVDNMVLQNRDQLAFVHVPHETKTSLEMLQKWKLLGNTAYPSLAADYANKGCDILPAVYSPWRG